MYGFDAGLAGAMVIRVQRRPDFSVDVERVIESSHGASCITYYASLSTPKLLFLTSPNNPDGSLLAPDALRRLLTLPLLVIVDEAYIEFAGLENSVARWVLDHDNLVVLRTFSKWAGIAGLRLGYGIFPSWLMPALWKAKQPYNVNVAATVAGLAALRHRAEMQAVVEALVRERQRLFRGLGRVPFLHPYPSRANFVLCRVEGRDAAGLKAELAAQGILVRHYAKPGLENCIRVSAGKPEHTDALRAALRRIAEGSCVLPQ
jgi:histidinol-phosphate aminotransferase